MREQREARAARRVNRGQRVLGGRVSKATRSESAESKKKSEMVRAVRFAMD